jgi:hypothetical protein
MQPVSSSEPPTLPSPTPGPATFPDGTSIDVDKLNEEQADNTINVEFEDITAIAFVEKERLFRMSIADAVNKALVNGDSPPRRKRQNEQLTADNVMYVGEPITTDGGTLVVGFFAQFPDGGVVDGGVLVGAVDENSDVISAAVGGTLTEVKRDIPDGLKPPTSDDSGGLSGGEVAAIAVVLSWLGLGLG